MNLLKIFVLSLLLIVSITSQQQPDISKIQQQINLRWTFISEIQHTWFQNIIKQYFEQCQYLKQVNALYDCNTTVSKYKQFWYDFIDGVFLIKFKQSPVSDKESQLRSLYEVMCKAIDEWIIIYKRQQPIQIQQLYEDITGFPSNIMEIMQYYQQNAQEFNQFKETINWKPQTKSYNTRINKTKQQMQKDQIQFYKQYFNHQCFKSENYIKQCQMPFQRYLYYLKQLFFYYFQQPSQYLAQQNNENQKSKQQKSKQSDQKQNKTVIIMIKPQFDYKITTLWRNIKQIIQKHYDMGQAISLQQVQQYSSSILMTVMKQLIRDPEQHQDHEDHEHEDHEHEHEEHYHVHINNHDNYIQEGDHHHHDHDHDHNHDHDHDHHHHDHDHDHHDHDHDHDHDHHGHDHDHDHQHDHQHQHDHHDHSHDHDHDHHDHDHQHQHSHSHDHDQNESGEL